MGKTTPLVAAFFLAIGAPRLAAGGDVPAPDARAALVQSAQQLQQNIGKAIVYVRSWDKQVQSAALAAPAAASLLNQIHYQLSSAGSASVHAKLKAAQANAASGFNNLQKLPSACGVKGDQIETWLSQVDSVGSELNSAAAQALALQKSISTSELQWDAQIDHLTNPSTGKPPAGAKALAQLRKQPEPLYSAAHELYQSLSPGAPNSFQNLLKRFADAPLASCPNRPKSVTPAASTHAGKQIQASAAVVVKPGAPVLTPQLPAAKTPEPAAAHPGGRPPGNSTATSQAPSAKTPNINAGLQSVAGTLSSCAQGFGNTLKTRGVQMAAMVCSAPSQLANTITDLIKGDFSWDKDSAAPAACSGFQSQNSDPTLLDSVLSGKPLNQPLPYEVCSGIADVAMSLPPGAVLARIPIVTSLITKAVAYAPKIAPLISAGEKLGLLPKVLTKTGKTVAIEAAGDVASKDAQNAEIAKALGINPSSQVTKTHLGNKVLNETDKLTFSDGGKQTSVVLKRYSEIAFLKDEMLKRRFSFQHIYATPEERFRNEQAMHAAFTQAGLKTSDIVLAEPQKKALVVRFIQGDLMSGIHAKALAGDQTALEKISRLGQTLAKVHKNHLVVGDLGPDNVMYVDGDINFFDLDQASRDGPPGWDIAEFLYEPAWRKASISASIKESVPQWGGVTQAFLSGYLKGGGDVRNVQDALNPAYQKVYGPLLDPKALQEIVPELKAAAQKAPEALPSPETLPKGLFGKLFGKTDTATVSRKAQFMAQTRNTLSNADKRIGPNNPALALEEPTGLSDSKIKAIAQLGSQGVDGTCARYAITACLKAADSNLNVEDVKAAAQAAKWSRGEVPIEDDKVFDIAQMPKDQARIAIKAYQDQIRTKADNIGMLLADQDVAHAVGYQVRNLEPSHTTWNSYVSWFESDTPENADQFLQNSAHLRDVIDQELAQGRPVVASITGGLPDEEYGGVHAITIVQKGKNNAGVMTVKYYDSAPGRIHQMPWEDFHPMDGALAEPAGDFPIPRTAQDALNSAAPLSAKTSAPSRMTPAYKTKPLDPDAAISDAKQSDLIYLNSKQRRAYKLTIQNGKLYDASGKLYDTNHGFSGKVAASFVMDGKGNLYADNSHSLKTFHHSSFLAGEPVAGAGNIYVTNGVLEMITNTSGHYKPDQALMRQVYNRLEQGGVKMSEVKIFDEQAGQIIPAPEKARGLSLKAGKAAKTGKAPTTSKIAKAAANSPATGGTVSATKEIVLGGKAYDAKAGKLEIPGEHQILFRGGSDRPPKQVFQKGLQSWAHEQRKSLDAASDASPEELHHHVLTQHKGDPFVSTSRNFKAAFVYMKRGGWIYVIRTNRGLDTQLLFKKAKFKDTTTFSGDKELSVPGEITPKEIVGAWPMGKYSGTSDEFRKGSLSCKELIASLGAFIDNPNYSGPPVKITIKDICK